MQVVKKITQVQLFFIIIQAQVGIGIISLPSSVAKYSKGDAWISVILAGVFALICILLMWLLNRRFPTLTIFEMMNDIVGKYIAWFIKIAYIAYFFSVATLTVLRFVQTVNLWVLPRTPVWIVSIIFIAICVYCAKENLKVIARFCMLISIFLVVLFILTLYILKDVNYLNILPVGESGIKNIFKGSSKVITSSLGFEVILVLFPYCLGKNSGKLKVLLLANGLVTIFYVFITFVVLAYFGPASLKIIPEPILYMLKYQSFKIIERTDLVFFSIWIVTVAATLIIYLYITSKGLSNIFTNTKRSIITFYIATILFLLVLIVPINDKVIGVLEVYLSLASYLFIFVLPFILLIVSVLQGKKDGSKAVQL